VFDHPRLPADLARRIKEWLDQNAAAERKPKDTDEQFYYRARKKAIGPFKRECWSLPPDVRAAIAADLEKTFTFLFEQLKVNGTAGAVRKSIRPPSLTEDQLHRAGERAVDDAEAGE
jgi:hypothetical protein